MATSKGGRDMPHTARKRSESAFYHVVTKGAGDQVIFENSADRVLYLQLLEDATDSFKVQIHAYCLMSNHVHLLIRDMDRDLSPFMKQINERYAMSFAKNVGRIGNVFRTPFWSEAVENESYYLSALRYIHANPEPAGICSLADYPWSSYKAYLEGSSFVTTGLALDLLGGAEAFVEFGSYGAKYALPFSGSRLRRHLSPDELWHIACEAVGRDVILELRKMEQRERQPYIERLATAGFTQREICRVTGLGKNVVHRTIEGL